MRWLLFLLCFPAFAAPPPVVPGVVGEVSMQFPPGLSGVTQDGISGGFTGILTSSCTAMDLVARMASVIVAC